MNKKCIATIGNKQQTGIVHDITADCKTVWVETSEDIYAVEADKVELIIEATKKEKFTSKIEYSTGKEYNENTNTNQVYTRFLDLTITAKTQEIAEELWFDCTEYLKESFTGKFEHIGCPSTDELRNGKFSYTDSLGISDKEEYEEAKELYIEWKKGAK